MSLRDGLTFDALKARQERLDRRALGLPPQGNRPPMQKPEPENRSEPPDTSPERRKP